MVKQVLFVRHPAYAFFPQLLSDHKGEFDFDMPVSGKGLAQTRLLVGYLKQVLSQNPNAKVVFFSSPYRRAKSMADIVSAYLKLRRLQNPNHAVPQTPIQLIPALGEVPVDISKEQYVRLLQEQGGSTGNIGIFDRFVQQHPKVVVSQLEKKRKALERALGTIARTDADIGLVFTHRMTLATLLWDTQNRLAGKERRFSPSNFKELFELTGKIAHTSITRATLDANGLPVVRPMDFARLPHLKGRQSLVSGVPKRTAIRRIK